MATPQATKRPTIGDIIEVRTTKGLGYAQFCARDPQMGALIRVLPGLYDTRPTDLAALVKNKELFFVFFPLGPTVNKSLVEIVARCTVPEGAGMPSRARRRLPLGPNDFVWSIREEGRDRTTRTLTEDEKSLSPYAIWNVALLAERMARGWTPEKEAACWSRALV